MLRIGSICLPQDLGSGSRHLDIGRTRVTADFIAILMERVVIEMRKPKRLEHVGCVVCGTHEGEIAACPGCALTQYCSDECRHADARAGHEQICGLFQLLFAVARSEKVRAFFTSGSYTRCGPGEGEGTSTLD